MAFRANCNAFGDLFLGHIPELYGFHHKHSEALERSSGDSMPFRICYGVAKSDPEVVKSYSIPLLCQNPHEIAQATAQRQGSRKWQHPHQCNYDPENRPPDCPSQRFPTLHLAMALEIAAIN